MGVTDAIRGRVKTEKKAATDLPFEEVMKTM